MTDNRESKILANLEETRREVISLSKSKSEAWAIVEEYQRVLDQCPGGYPDGTGMMSPERWIQWAKKQLGYSS